MKKVAIIKERVGRHGGLEKYAKRLITAFAERGCHVTLLTTGKPLITCEAEVVSLVRPFPVLSVLNIWQFNRQCRKWLQHHHYDVIFGMDRTTEQTHYRAGNGVHAAYLRRCAEGKSSLRKLSLAINPLHRTILDYEKQAFESPSLRRLFVNSHMVRQELLNHYTIDEGKVSVTHNGVEWLEWQQHFDAWPTARESIQRSLGLDPSCFQLLFIGHGFRRKGLHHFLKALAITEFKDIQLSIVGRDKETEAFRHLANKLGLGNRVRFFGVRDDVVAFYQAADALAIPSTYDPFANVTIEALAMGLFVISSKHNGGSEILSPTTGYVIEDLDNPEAIVNAINIAVQHPKTLHSASTIRQAAYSYDFSVRLKDIVDETLASSGSSHAT